MCCQDQAGVALLSYTLNPTPNCKPQILNTKLLTDSLTSTLTSYAHTTCSKDTTSVLIKGYNICPNQASGHIDVTMYVPSAVPRAGVSGTIYPVMLTGMP